MGAEARSERGAHLLTSLPPQRRPQPKIDTTVRPAPFATTADRPYPRHLLRRADSISRCCPSNPFLPSHAVKMVVEKGHEEPSRRLRRRSRKMRKHVAAAAQRRRGRRLFSGNFGGSSQRKKKDGEGNESTSRSLSHGDGAADGSYNPLLSPDRKWGMWADYDAKGAGRLEWRFRVTISWQNAESTSKLPSSTVKRAALL